MEDRTNYWPIVVLMTALILIALFGGRNSFTSTPEEIDAPTPAWMWVGLVIFIVAAAVSFLVFMFVGIRQESVPVEMWDGKPEGYKVLRWQGWTGNCDDSFYYYSPNGIRWEFDGEFFLTADQLPTLDNTNGIYLKKSPVDPELDYYMNSIENAELVRVRVVGDYVEHETGLRVTKAIVEQNYGGRNEHW